MRTYPYILIALLYTGYLATPLCPQVQSSPLKKKEGYANFPLKNPPESFHPLLRQAFTLQLEGKNEESKKAYEQYFQKGEESAYSRAEYARVLYRLQKMDDAAREAKRAHTLDPKTADYTILLSELLRKVNKSDEALDLLQKEHSKNIQDGEIEFYLAETLMMEGRTKEARTHYTQALYNLQNTGTKFPLYRSIALWRLANIYLEERDLARTKLYLLRYIKYNPTNLYARYVLAVYVYYPEHDYTRCVEQLSTLRNMTAASAKEQGIDLLRVHFLSGLIYYLYENPQSIRHLYIVLQQQPDSPVAKGLYAAWKNDKKVAMQSLLPSIRKSPHQLIPRVAVTRILKSENRPDLYLPELMAVSAIAYDENQNKLGVESALEALDLKLKQPELDVPLSAIYRQLFLNYDKLKQPARTLLYLQKFIDEADKEGRWDKNLKRDEQKLNQAKLMGSPHVGRAREALEIVNQLNREDPSSLAVLETRGWIYLMNGRHAKAVDDFTNTLQKDSGRIESRYYRAVANYETGNFDKAEEDLTVLLKERPNFAEASNFLGYMYASRGEKLDRALELVSKAVQYAPSNGSYQDSLGWVYYKKGDYDRSLYHLQFAATLMEEENQESAVVYEHIGDAYAKLKQSVESNEYYRRAQMILKKKKRRLLKENHLYEYTREDRQLEDSLKQKLKNQH